MPRTKPLRTCGCATEIRIAFETPMPRGFDTKDQVVAAAEEHVRTQFARIGVDRDDVEVSVKKAEMA